jgi:hypothetical protein
VATIDPLLGIVTGVSTGAATISYILGTGCAAAITITINAAPAPISGTAALCKAGTTALSDASTGGVWSSSSTEA